MFSLIVAILFGLSITFFAFQNSTGVPIVIGNIFLQNIPVYLVVVISILVGIMMAWFISAIEGMSYFMNIRKKEKVIDNDEKQILAQQKKIRELEVENAKLRGDKRGVVLEQEHEYETDLEYKPSFWDRLFPHSSRRYSKHI